VVPGLHFLAGLHLPFYHDLVLDGQFRYSYVVGNATIRDDDTGEEISYQELNLGGLSLQVGLGYRF